MAKNYSITVEFLEDLVLDATREELDDEDKLNITTIHSAKGLEYDVVFFMDLIEEITPRCKEDDEADSEELRCVYVAITRARKKLYIFAPKSHNNPAFGIFSAQVSHFLNEENVLSTLNINKPNDSIFNKETDDVWDFF